MKKEKTGPENSGPEIDDKPHATSPGLRLLTKKEKAWFFLLCGYQPKINKLIFHVFCLVQFVSATVA
jgi:hypothetical protein